MKGLKDIKKRVNTPLIAALILEATAVILLTAAFCVPPTGVIDPSVLAAVGELFAFRSLWLVGKAIDNGRETKVTHGKTTIEIGDGES